MDEKLRKAIFNSSAWYRIAQPNEKPDGYILVEEQDGSFVNQIDIMFAKNKIPSECELTVWENGKYEFVVFDEDGYGHSATVEVTE